MLNLKMEKNLKQVQGDIDLYAKLEMLKRVQHDTYRMDRP